MSGYLPSSYSQVTEKCNIISYPFRMERESVRTEKTEIRRYKTSPFLIIPPIKGEVFGPLPLSLGLLIKRLYRNVIAKNF